MRWIEGPCDFIPFPRFTLVKNERDFSRVLKEVVCKDHPPFVLDGKHATVHEFVSLGETSMVVCVSLPKNAKDYAVYSLLAHEAVHIWQKVEQMMGEQDTSREFEAYAVQFICKNLFKLWRNG